jgi:hypothetical protein
VSPPRTLAPPPRRQAAGLGDGSGGALGVRRNATNPLLAGPGGDDEGGLDEADLAAAAAAVAADAASRAEAVGAGAGPGPGDKEDLVAKRAIKLRFQQGIALFNKKPKKGARPAGGLGVSAAPQPPSPAAEPRRALLP